MDKNSLILEIKNDLNSIKKQVEVTLAKIDVLEALIKLEVTSGASNEELAVVTKSESRDNACIVRELDAEEVAEPVKQTEPVVEAPVEELEVEEPAPVAVPIEESRDNACIVRESEPEPKSEQIIEEDIEEDIEEEVEEELIPNSSLLTPNRETQALRNLMSVIGLNDRFRFRHDLFSNSDELFKETIDILNKIEDFDKAVDYLVQKFAWDEEDATVVYFYDIIKPKF